MSDTTADAFRWQTFFQHATQPIFLLNRRRRVLFVNRAWEQCTGLTYADVRGRVCRRRSSTASLERDEAILSACAAPPEAMEGRTAQVRRRAPASPDWWLIQFQPLTGAEGLLGVLGTIRVLSAPTQAPFQLPEKLMLISDRQAARYQLEDIPGSSPAMRRVLEQARLAAQTSVPVTLIGAPGAGKEWLARAIHLRSDRRDHYFASLDASRIPADLIGEALLGARSAQMGIGTFFLRQPAALPREWQSRLVEAMPGAALPRMIFGYDGDPSQAIESGRLLEELHCAACPITIAIPALSERPSDLARLVEVFLQRARELEAHQVTSISGDAMQALAAHDWPGNLRELQEVFRDTVRRARTDRIELADLPFFVRHGPLPPDRRLPLDSLLEQVERRLIELALKLAQNNQTRAAELLAVWRPRLIRRMEKLGIQGE